MLLFDKTMEIKRIRCFLLETNYDLYYQNISGIYNYFFNPWQKYNVVFESLKKYDESIQNLFMLLMLGEKVSLKKMEKSFGIQVINDFIEVGFLKKENEMLISDNYAIIPYLERYYVVNIPDEYIKSNRNQDVYIGLDSYKLANAIPHKKHEKHLDLCSGSGIQCIIGSDAFEEGYVVEINKRAIPVLKFNIALNELKNKIHVFNDDLYNPFTKKEVFDVITANPPFIPVPDELEFPLAGDGGKDGLKIIRQIIKGFDRYLADDGIGMVIGEAIGNAEGPFLVNELYNLLPYGYEGTVFLQNISEADSFIECFVEFFIKSINNKMKKEKLQNICKKNFKQFHATHVYSFILKIVKKGKYNPSVYKQVKNYMNFEMSVKPKFIKEYSYMDSPNTYFIVVEGKIIATVNEKLKHCVQLCDGKHTFEEILDMAIEKEKDRESLSNIFLTMCKELKKQNIMKFN